MDDCTGLFDVLVVFEEYPERVLFFKDTMTRDELARAEKAHGTFINAGVNADTMWLFHRYFNDFGQQLKEDTGSKPFAVSACKVIHFGFVL